METVEEADYLVGLFLFHDGMAGQTQFLTMDAFGDREGTTVPFLVACLFVWRDRVVDHGLHSVLLQILLEFITSFTKDGEDMIDTV